MMQLLSRMLLLCGSLVLCGACEISKDGCGVTKGCYRVPKTCSGSVDCVYFLTWQNDEGNNSVRFEYSAKFVSSHRQPWAAFGVSDAPKMPEATVVDCIVNGSNNNQVEIQMSYNGDHGNSPLSDKYLGLRETSLKGSMEGDHICCKFTRLRVLVTRDPEENKVKNLTSPYYVLLATGPTDGNGTKKMHDFNAFDPYPSPVKLDFDNYTNNGNSELYKGTFVRVHVTLMVVAWMVLASLGMFTSRYMKNQWKENGTICRKPVWFQLHRIAMASVLGLTVTGILFIFAYKKWTFIVPYPNKDPYTLHPSLGITLGGLLVLNLIGGMLRPDIHSPSRIYFRWFHTVLGHGSHLLAAVTMYFGVMQSEACMPPWGRWVVVIFACWRILSDVVLTLVKIRFKDPPADYLAIANNETDDDANFIAACRCAVMIIYSIGIVVLAVTLIVAANVST